MFAHITTYLLLAVAVVSPAALVRSDDDIRTAQLALYSPTAQLLFTVWSMFDWVKKLVHFHFHDHGTCRRYHT